MLWIAWQLAGAAGFLVGLSGVPGDIDTWNRWIDIAVSDPMVQTLAGYAVAIAEVVNYPVTRAGLVIGGGLVLLWPLKLFWRFRHRVVFAWRRALDQPVWIGRDRAHDLVAMSPWATSRQRRSEKPKSIFDVASYTSRDPEALERLRMFGKWCGLVLKGSAEHNKEAYRKTETAEEFDEVQLKKWLDGRYQNDIIGEFGPP